MDSPCTTSEWRSIDSCGVTLPRKKETSVRPIHPEKIAPFHWINLLPIWNSIMLPSFSILLALREKKAEKQEIPMAGGVGWRARRGIWKEQPIPTKKHVRKTLKSSPLHFHLAFGAYSKAKWTICPGSGLQVLSSRKKLIRNKFQPCICCFFRPFATFCSIPVWLRNRSTH